MRILNIALLNYLLFITQACVGQNISNNVFCWLNIDYVECMKNKLPCECEEITQSYFSITLDTATHSKYYGIALTKFEQMEPFIYNIRKIKLNEYDVLRGENNYCWARIVIINDTLHFIENNTLLKFVISGGCSEFNSQHFKKMNVEIFNKALEFRGYPRIEEIVGQDYLMFECNKWLNNSNVLYAKGKPHRWIISILNDTLTINEVIDEDRDPEEPIQTKKTHSFKWY